MRVRVPPFPPRYNIMAQSINTEAFAEALRALHRTARCGGTQTDKDMKEDSHTLSVSVRIRQEELARMSMATIEPFVKKKIADALAYKLVQGRVDYQRREEYMSYATIYSATINVFTDEELRKHDQDIIEEFCSREK